MALGYACVSHGKSGYARLGNPGAERARRSRASFPFLRQVGVKGNCEEAKRLLIRRPLGQGVSELLLGGGFTSPYPLRPDPGASRAVLPMAISLCPSRKRRCLGPQNAQNPNPKGGVLPRGGLGTTRLSLRRKWHSQFAPGNDHPCGEPFLLRDPLVPLREREKDNLKRCQPLAIYLFPLREREKASRTHGFATIKPFSSTGRGKRSSQAHNTSHD